MLGMTTIVHPLLDVAVVVRLVHRPLPPFDFLSARLLSSALSTLRPCTAAQQLRGQIKDLICSGLPTRGLTSLQRLLSGRSMAARSESQYQCLVCDFICTTYLSHS